VLRLRFAILVLVALVPALASADVPLALETLDGVAVPLEAPASGARVLHFWATWCPSCRDELAALASAARSCEGGDVEVLAIDVAESADDVRDYLAKTPLDLRVLRDPDGRAWRSGGGRELPANLIWTPDTRRWTFGPISESDWRERLAALGCR